jgi:hypothetical protein
MSAPASLPERAGVAPQALGPATERAASLPERSNLAPERGGFTLWPLKIYLQETFRILA